jgi:hypothetical protein
MSNYKYAKDYEAGTVIGFVDHRIGHAIRGFSDGEPVWIDTWRSSYGSIWGDIVYTPPPPPFTAKIGDVITKEQVSLLPENSIVRANPDSHAGVVVRVGHNRPYSIGEYEDTWPRIGNYVQFRVLDVPDGSW